MSSVHFVFVGDDVSLADALADVFDEAGLTIAEADAALGDGDVAVLVWSEASAHSPSFMNAAQQFMDQGRAVIASFVAIADATNVGAPVFDLSDWDGKNRNEPVLVPLIYAVERRMPASAAVSEAEIEEADFEDVAPEEEVLELSQPIAAAVVAEEVEPAPQSIAPEPESLRTAQATPIVAATPKPAKPPKAVKPTKAAQRRVKPPREKPRRVRAAAERRKYMPPPPGRLRAAMPFLGGLTACIVAVFVAAPLLGDRPVQVASAPRAEIAATERGAGFARVEEIAPREFAELIPLNPVPTLTLAPAPRAIAQSPRNPLLQLASASSTQRPRRTRTPRPITSWDTPDPKRRGYLVATGGETPQRAQAQDAATQAPPAPERKPKDAV